MDLEVELGVAAVDEPQDGGQQVRRHGGDHAEPEDTGEGGLGGLRLLHQLRHRVEDGPRADREPLPGGREQYLPRRTLEELDTECLFEGRNRAREGGLTHADGGRRIAEVQMLGDGRERSELRKARLLASVRAVRGAVRGRH